MSLTVSRFVLAVVAFFAVLAGDACAQSFQIEVSQLNIVVAPEFRHAEQRVPIVGTAAGFDFTTLRVSSDASWVVPSIDAASKEVVLTYQTAGLIASSSTATITLAAGATTDFFAIKASVAPLTVTKLLDDPVRSRMYGIQQDGLNAGAVIVIDPLTNTKVSCITVGRKPTDLAVSKDGSELLVLNAVDKTLTAIDLATLRAKEDIVLPTYVNWGEADTTGDVAYGAGDIIYYSDGSWAPVLYVFKRSTRQILQQVTDTDPSSGFGFGDFALSADGSALYGWMQYGWSAGSAAAYVTKYTVGPSGTLTFVQKTATSYPTGLKRDPLDTPVLIDATGERAFLKELAVNTSNVTETVRTFPSEVYSISPGGEIAATSSAIFQASTSVSLYTLPVTTNVQAISSDYARLIYFDKTARAIGSINLMDVIGPGILGRDLSPGDGSITLAPTHLRWTPLPGVDKYQVYLGSTESVVQNAGTGDPSYLGEVTGSSIAVGGTLAPGSKYFWRVDAVGSGGVSKGDVFEFTVSAISSDVAKINAATVQGHADYQVEVKLNSATAGLSWTASADQSWVGFASAAGTTPATLTVKLNASQLAAGVHTATINIAAAGQQAFSLPVSLEVDPLALTVLESDRSSAVVYAISEKAPTAGGTSRAYLLELDSAAKTIKRAVRVGSSATDIAVHNKEGRIYVANWLGGVMLAIDKATFKQVQGYGFTKPDGYTTNDVYKIAAGAQGRVMIESEDQWVTLGIYDTVAGKMLKTYSVREGGGEFDETGRYYYHGDNNSSGATIQKYDVIGDAFTKTADTRVESVSYYGSRTVVVSEDGERVFWNGGYLDKNLVIQWLIGDEIFSTSGDGKLAFSATKIYDVDARKAVLSMPANTKVSAYNSMTLRLVTQVGSEVKFFDIGGSGSLAAPVLSVGTVTGSSVQLTWTDESLETSFTLQMRIKGGANWQDASSTIAANATAYVISGLLPQKEYEFRIKADTSVYTSPWSNIVAATTASAVLPYAETQAASNVASTSVTLNGVANPQGFAATASFEYGLTESLGSTLPSQSVGSGSANVSVQRSVFGLQSGKTYYYRLVGQSSEGIARGAILSFSTGFAKPSISGATVLTVTQTSASLRAFLNPNGTATTAYFEYGPSQSFGLATTSRSAGSGSASIAFDESIGSLAPNTLYYYRLVATSAAGVTTGQIASFRTASAPVETQLVALDDVTFTTKGQVRIIDVLANDTGGTRDSLSVVLTGAPLAGSATVTADQNFAYVPNSSFTGYDSFTYKVHDGTRSSTATVVVRDTYQSAAGIYTALIGTSNSPFERAGLILVDVTRTGLVTGKVHFEGGIHPFKTTLRFDGAVAFQIARKSARPILVSFTIDPLQQKLAGTVGTPEAVSFSGKRSPYNEFNPAPQAGLYTMIIASGAGMGGEGHGIATLKVAANGSIQIKGRTANGQSFSTTSLIDGDGKFPLFATSTKALSIKLHGVLAFRSIAETSDFDGTIGVSFKESAVVQQMTAIGSRYVIPAKDSLVLPLDATANNALLDFGKDDIRLVAEPLPITVTTKGIGSAGPGLKKLQLVRKTGLFSGKVAIDGKFVPFYGTIFQRQAEGFGQVIMAEGSGWVSLTDATPAAGDPDATQSNSGFVKTGGGVLTIGNSAQSDTSSAGFSITLIGSQ